MQRLADWVRNSMECTGDLANLRQLPDNDIELHNTKSMQVPNNFLCNSCSFTENVVKIRIKDS